MNVLIFGFGIMGGGFESAMYYVRRGDYVRITDIRSIESFGEQAEILMMNGVEVIAGQFRTEDFLWADLVIKTPSIRPDNEFLEFASNVETDFSILFSDPAVSQTKVICIAGSKGKTIAASALCHALNRLGKKTRMCGNMGISPFSELQRWEHGDIPQYLVCEMSSWQVRDVFNYLKTDIPSFEALAIASFIQEEETTTGAQLASRILQVIDKTRCLLCPDNLKDIINESGGKKRRKIHAIESSYRGMSKNFPKTLRTTYGILRHIGFTAADINNALKSFKGVPHRVEFVLNKNNVMYINDSAATIPEAVNFTVRNFENLPLHLICGGTGRKLEARSMLSSMKGAASLHLLDGSFTRLSIIPMLEANCIPYHGPFETMKEAVESARSCLGDNLKKVQVVLLSPGASAYEHFSHEFDRGDQFRESVTSRSKQ